MILTTTTIEIGLAAKTGRRAAITCQKYTQSGLSPLCAVSAISTISSGTAFVLLSSARCFSFTQFNFLIKPLAVAGTSLGLFSDFIDKSFRWYSLLI